MKRAVKIIIAGLAAGLVSEALLGALFVSAPIQRLLYDPQLQSKIFIELTPTRDLFPSIAGLVVLSIAHSWLFQMFQPSIPGATWIRKGIFWGFTIWLMYWVFQEWFIYHTLLKEPLLLNMVELVILLGGSLAEGLIISKFLFDNKDEEKDVSPLHCPAGFDKLSHR